MHRRYRILILKKILSPNEKKIQKKKKEAKTKQELSE
jgi:hypothetical protein